MKPVFRLNDEQMTATTPEFYHSTSRKSSTPSHHNNFDPSPQTLKRESPRNFAYSPRYRPDLAKYIPQSNGPSETPYEKRTMQISNNFTPRNIGFAATISAFYNPAEHKEERGSSVEPWRTTTQNPQPSPRTMVTSPLAKSMFFNKDDDTNILTRKKYDDNMNSTTGFRSTPDNLNIPSFRKTTEVKEKSDDNTSPKKSTITYYHIDEFINKYKNMNTPRETREVERKDPSPRALSSNRLAPHSTPKNVVNIMRNSFYAESPNSQQSPPTFKKQNNLHQDVAKNSHETSPRFQRLLNNAHTFEYKKAEQKDLTELTTSLNQPILTRSFSNFKRDIDKHLEATPAKKTVTEKTERTTPRNTSVNPSRVEQSEEKVSLDSFVTKVDRGATFSNNFSSKLEKKNELKTNEKENISASYNETKGLTRTMPSFRDSPFKASHTILNNSQIFKQLEKTAATEPGFNSQYSEYAKLNIRNSTRTSTSRNDDSTDSSQEDEPRRTRSPPTYYMNNLRRHLVNFREGDYLNEIYREHFKQTFESLKFSKYMRPSDTRSLSEKRVFLTRKETYRFKKTLIFDMDETLIHCNEGKNVPSDVKIPIKLPQGGVMEAGINIRPYARECLKELSQYFEVIVFTASHKTYANAVLDYLDPKKQFIQHRLFRDSCIYTDERVYVKDLRILGNRNLQDVILVDNAAYSFGFQVENGVPIIPFYDDKNDQELKHLTTYLKSLCNVKDVREVNKKTFKLHLYANYDTPQEVIENVVLMN